MSVERVTSAANTGQASISSMVQLKLRQNAVLAGLFSDKTQFANPGDTSVSFPRRTNSFSVQKLSGAVKGDDQESIFALDTLPLDQEAHIQWVIKKFDQQRAKVAILQESIEEATIQHAIGLDADIYEILTNNVAAGNEVSGAISAAKVIEMLTKASTARIPKQNRAFVFSNAEYGNLLNIADFIDASKSNLDIVRTGQIGTLFGVPVFESDSLAAGESFLVHKEAIAYAFGAAPAIEDKSVIEYGTGSRRWVMDQLYGVKSLNEGNLVVRLS
ncbi:MAG: hypothetical protein KC506_03920 [Nanoarchaeota archaeon]|nr:hypothetical protein [Nanoarchaeota archaeon]